MKYVGTFVTASRNAPPQIVLFNIEGQELFFVQTVRYGYPIGTGDNACHT